MQLVSLCVNATSNRCCSTGVGLPPCCPAAAVAGLSKRQLAAIQAGPNSSSNAADHDASAAAASQASLLRSLPLAVLADPSPSRPQAGIVLSVAPLLGAHPYTDQGVPKWLHVHVRPSVRGLLRVIKVRVAQLHSPSY
jgi:hypothetical protein